MTNKELQDQLTLLQNKLRESNDVGDKEKIDYYLGELNRLWEKARILMIKNASEDGIGFTK